MVSNLIGMLNNMRSESKDDKQRDIHKKELVKICAECDFPLKAEIQAFIGNDKRTSTQCDALASNIEQEFGKRSPSPKR